MITELKIDQAIAYMRTRACDWFTAYAAVDRDAGGQARGQTQAARQEPAPRKLAGKRPLTEAEADRCIQYMRDRNSYD
jgi:hypothetical protein